MFMSYFTIRPPATPRAGVSGESRRTGGEWRI
jgi:hypothetical protein